MSTRAIARIYDDDGTSILTTMYKHWDEYPLYQQRGRAFYKNSDGYWILDENIPVFADDRIFINQWLVTEE